VREGDFTGVQHLPDNFNRLFPFWTPAILPVADNGMM
jgi:hypothetical protein